MSIFVDNSVSVPKMQWKQARNTLKDQALDSFICDDLDLKIREGDFHTSLLYKHSFLLSLLRN